MTNPEFKAYTSPRDWKINERGRIFPPPSGPSMERAVIGINKLRNINWPIFFHSTEIDRVETTLGVFAHQFIAQVLEEHPTATLDFGMKRHEVILRDIKRGIINTAKSVPQLEERLVDTENKAELQMAIDEAINERNEMHGAEHEAIQIIWNQTDPTDNHILFRRAYRRSPGELDPFIQLLLRTAQNYLVWETFADRKGYGQMPNIWETLITMYVLGMESYYIDPETDKFKILIRIKDNGQEHPHGFTISRGVF